MRRQTTFRHTRSTCLLLSAAVGSVLFSGCASTTARSDKPAKEEATPIVNPMLPPDGVQQVAFTPGHSGVEQGASGCTTGRCGAAGCRTCSNGAARELDKVSLPDYRIEPPDILLIEATNSLRPEHAQLRPGEVLRIQVANTIPIDPLDDPIARGFKSIDGLYQVQTNGHVDLGPAYGTIAVRGLTIDEARQSIELNLRQVLKAPQVMVTLVSDQARQHVSGEHLVRPDGTVSLGVYGSVYVSGMTLSTAKRALEKHLGTYIHGPEVTVDVLAYNSKVYYIVTDGGGAGEQVFRFPCTGNETVLDAMAQINGLPTVSSKKNIWIARPTRAGSGYHQRIPIDWDAIVQDAGTETNYQILPGDRIYVKADDLITFDTAIAKLTAPFERVLGFILLGNGTVRALQRGRNAQNGTF